MDCVVLQRVALARPRLLPAVQLGVPLRSKVCPNGSSLQQYKSAEAVRKGVITEALRNAAETGGYPPTWRRVARIDQRRHSAGA